MSSLFDLKIDVKGLEKAQRMLAHIPGAFKRAQNRALRYTMNGMKTETLSGVTETYYAKASEIRPSMNVKVSGQSGMLRVSGPRLGLEKYYMTPKKPAKRKRNQGLRGAVKRTGIKNFPGAFLIRLGKAGKYYPYERVGTGRWDIKRIMSPAAAQLTKNVWENNTAGQVGSLQERLAEKFDERLRHEVMFELGVFSR